MANSTRLTSAKQHLPAHRDAFQCRRIDGNAEAGPFERRRPAAPAEGDVPGRKRLAHQLLVVRAPHTAKVLAARREVPPRRRENRCLADLAAELIAEAVLLRKLRELQRREEATALGEANVEQVARAPFNGALGVKHAA